MLFDTPVYFFFLALVVFLYWRLGWRKQNLFLLAASYFFYGWWDWRFLLLMAGSTVVDFFIANALGRITEPSRRRALLTFSLVVNFSVLGFFKYFGFFAESLQSSLHLIGFHQVSLSFLKIILPPGISFYTFQEVAYIVDVYKGRLAPARSLVDYSLFVSLFPHLIAGPIQRPSHLLPQVQQPRTFNANAFFDGCMLIASGLFRKCVIADQCAWIANTCFDGGFGHSAMATVLGVVAFAFQIYGDFSAYSDFARGSAQLLGFHFMVNFRQPYLSASLQEFWRRWHISLSTWLRDYLYIPLGGSRGSSANAYRNLMLTMVLGGLWHGANWTFVAWGAIHGIGLCCERIFRPLTQTPEPTNPVALWARRGAVFLFVCFGWLFFRAKSLPEAGFMLNGLLKWEWRQEFATAAGVLVFLAGLMIAMDIRMNAHDEEYLFQHTVAPRRIAVGLAFLIGVIFLSASASNAFIYFQF